MNSNHFGVRTGLNTRSGDYTIYQLDKLEFLAVLV